MRVANDALAAATGVSGSTEEWEMLAEPNHTHKHPSAAAAAAAAGMQRSTSAARLLWDDASLLQQPLEWLTSKWLDRSGMGPLPQSCRDLLATDAYASLVAKLHDSEQVALGQVAAAQARRWQRWCEEDRKGERAAKDAAEMLRSEGRSLSVRLEQRELSARAALDQESERALYLGAKAWASALGRLHVEWSPWASHVLASRASGWVLAPNEDCAGRRLLLERAPALDYSEATWRVEERRTGREAAAAAAAAAATAEASAAVAEARALDPTARKDTLEDDGASESSEEEEAALEGWEDDDAAGGAGAGEDLEAARASGLKVVRRPGRVSLGQSLRSGGMAHRDGEKSVRTMEATVVRPELVTVGRLVLTTMSLYFHPAAAQPAASSRAAEAEPEGQAKRAGPAHQRDARWRLDSLVGVYGRRYLLRPDCAMEVHCAQLAFFLPLLLLLLLLLLCALCPSLDSPTPILCKCAAFFRRLVVAVPGPPGPVAAAAALGGPPRLACGL